MFKINISVFNQMFANINKSVKLKAHGHTQCSHFEATNKYANATFNPNIERNATAVLDRCQCPHGKIWCDNNWNTGNKVYGYTYHDMSVVDVDLNQWYTAAMMTTRARHPFKVNTQVYGQSLLRVYTFTTNNTTNGR